MRDRVSTKILDNGATRYGVYDEDGNLLRYEYIKLEDEPDEEGDFFNKANMLPDYIPALLGLKMGNPQVKDALNVLANIGNVHVWKRDTTATGSTDYPTSTDRNAFGEGFVDYKPAGYTLGERLTSVDLYSSGSSGGVSKYNYSSSVVVSEDGTVDLGPVEGMIEVGYVNSTGTGSAYIEPVKGKFVKTLGYSEFSTTDILYVHDDASCISWGRDPTTQLYYTRYDGISLVIGYPETGSSYLTYLGALGDKTRIEVGSYVGTGTYDSSNPCSITFSFAPKVIMILYDRYLGTNIARDPSRGLSRVVMDEITTSYEGRFGFGDGSNSYGKKSADGKTFFWYNNSAANQYNESNTKYYVLAIG